MIAVIDIGSNTIRLVMYTIENGQPRSMLNKKYAVGLAGYVDESNRVRPEGVQVLLSVLSDIKSILDYIPHERIFPFGTATLRNSVNGPKIVELIRKTCGFDVSVLTGEEEAVFSYHGAMQSGIGNSGLLIDVGGGSTELAFFREKTVIQAASVPLGSLNLYKRYVDGLLPTPKEAKKIKKAVKKSLESIKLLSDDLITQPIYCVGGTARAAALLMRQKYSFGVGNEYTVLHLKDFLSIIDGDTKELMHDILRVAADRIHTIIPGLLIFQAVAKYYGSSSFITSQYGVREGYLMHRLKSDDIPEHSALSYEQ